MTSSSREAPHGCFANLTVHTSVFPQSRCLHTFLVTSAGVPRSASMLQSWWWPVGRVSDTRLGCGLLCFGPPCRAGGWRFGWCSEGVTDIISSRFGDVPQDTSASVGQRPPNLGSRGSGGRVSWPARRSRIVLFFASGWREQDVAGGRRCARRPFARTCRVLFVVAVGVGRR